MDKPARKSRGEELDFGLVAANQRLSPEERLNAFLTHSQLMMELYKAGEEIRRAGRAHIKGKRR
jgi:hypothetical protein